MSSRQAHQTDSARNVGRAAPTAGLVTRPAQGPVTAPIDASVRDLPRGLGSQASAAPDTAQLVAIADCVDRLATLAVVPRETLDDLKQKIDGRRFDLVVAGQYKRGKTSLINALVGAELLPVAVVPLTSIVTALSYGPHPTASVILETGESRQIPLDELANYVTERRNPNNEKRVREAYVTYPSPWLRGGVRLIDTPGVGSVYQKNTDVAHRFLPKADAVLFLLSVDQPISQAECEFLASVREHSDKILFILNKTDLLSETELAESVEFTREALAQIIGAPPKLFPLSARLALAARLRGDEELQSTSRMPELSQALREFLAKEKDSVLAASIGRQVRRAVSQARFDLELELKSLTTPLAELERKVRLFEEKRTEVLLTGEDLDVLVGNDAGRALQRPLEEELKAFKDELKREVVAKIEAKYREQRSLPLRELHRAMENTAIAAIREGFDEWQAGESAAIEKTFEAFCARHGATIDGVVDELFRFASDLFAVPFAPQSVATFHGIESHFQYKFWSEPPSLRVLTSSLMLALPSVVGGRLVLNRVREFALESIEMQAGRMRYDFGQRLDKALAVFRHELSHKVGGAIDGIAAAVQKALNRKAAGESASVARLEALTATLRALDEIDESIAGIAERMTYDMNQEHSQRETTTEPAAERRVQTAEPRT